MRAYLHTHPTPTSVERLVCLSVFSELSSWQTSKSRVEGREKEVKGP